MREHKYRHHPGVAPHENDGDRETWADARHESQIILPGHLLTPQLPPLEASETGKRPGDWMIFLGAFIVFQSLTLVGLLWSATREQPLPAWAALSQLVALCMLIVVYSRARELPED